MIRAPIPSEAARLSALMRQTFMEAFGAGCSAHDLEAFLAGAYAPHLQAAELEDPAILTLVAEMPDGAWAGFGQVRFASPAPPGVTLREPVELGRLYVLPAHHGQGIGSGLMEALVAAGRNRGCDGVWLSVWQRAERSIAFYRRHGFDIVGTATFVVGSDVQDDWVMQRPLRPQV